MHYEHTQKSPFWLLLLTIAVGFAILTWTLRAHPEVCIPMGVAGAVMLLLAGSFAQLTITADEAGLRVQYGPLPLVFKRFDYASIRAAEASRTRLIDGWGIHYIPRRGWTYNIWGFDCVVLHREKDTVRIGTDDSNALAAFVRSKIATIPHGSKTRPGSRE